jgi:hypothetical protein
MAVEANINFDDDDDQEYNENDTGDTSFDPSTFGDDDSVNATNPEAIEIAGPAANAKAPDLDPEASQKPVDVEKLIDAEIRKMDQANRRTLREQQAEERRRLKERNEDQLRLMREMKRQEKTASQEQVTNTRSSAITQRVQAYSVSAALGLPGYIGAAAFDQFVIRPEEQQQVEQNKQYQAALDNYYRQLEKDRVQEKRSEEERIRQMPVEAVDVDAVREKHGLPPQATTPEAPKAPTQPSLSEVPTPEGQKQQQPVPPSEPAQPQTQPQQQTQASQPQQPVPQQQAAGGAPPSGPPPKQPVGQQPQADPPPIMPAPPAPPVASNIGTAAQIAAMAIQAAQMINGGIRDYGQQASKTVNATLGDNPYDAARQHSKLAQKSIDPLGVNIPVQVAVTGFDALLSLTEEIKKNAEKDLAFSPLSLSASVEGDIQKLLQSMDLAQRLDPTKAEVIRLNTQVEMAWNEFKVEMFENIAPHIIVLLTAMSNLIQLGTGAQKTTQDLIGSLISPAGQAGAFLKDVLERIAGNTKKPANAIDKSDLMVQVSKFLDPYNVRPINRPAAHPNP